jgi:hypothetical protein
MLFSFYGTELVLLWTGNMEAASQTGNIILFLALGTALHGVMYFPYALQLSHGRTGLILKNNLILLVALIPIVFWASVRHGSLGASVAWFILHLLSAAIVNLQIQKTFIPNALKLFLVDVTVPFVFAGLMALVAYKLILDAGIDTYARLVVGAATMVITSACLILRLPPVKQRLYARWILIRKILP